MSRRLRCPNPPFNPFRCLSIRQTLRTIEGADRLPRKVFPKPIETGRPNKNDEHFELATSVAEHMLGEPIEPESLMFFKLSNWTRASIEPDAIAKVAANTGKTESTIKKAFQSCRKAAYSRAAYLKKRRRL